jgi:hypothetical protein
VNPETNEDKRQASGCVRFKAPTFPSPETEKHPEPDAGTGAQRQNQKQTQLPRLDRIGIIEGFRAAALALGLGDDWG